MNQRSPTETEEFIHGIELELNNQNFYERKYDTHRAKFRGRPADYYPNSWQNTLRISIGLFLNYVFWSALFAGFLAYLLRVHEPAVWTYFGVWVFYVTGLLLLAYCGSKMRSKTEKKMIEDKVRLMKAEYDKHSKAVYIPKTDAQADAQAESNRNLTVE